MKKSIRIVAIGMLMCSLVGCCATTEDNGSDVDIKEHQERIEELETENEELKEEGIEFIDPNFEMYLRKVIGKLEGEISQEDIDKITYLSVSKYGMTISYDDITLEQTKETDYICNCNCFEAYNINDDGTFDSSYGTDGYEGAFLEIHSLEDVRNFSNLRHLVLGMDSPNTNFIDELTNLMTLDCNSESIISQYVRENRPDVYLHQDHKVEWGTAPVQ